MTLKYYSIIISYNCISNRYICYSREYSETPLTGKYLGKYEDKIKPNVYIIFYHIILYWHLKKRERRVWLGCARNLRNSIILFRISLFSFQSNIYICIFWLYYLWHEYGENCSIHAVHLGSNIFFILFFHFFSIIHAFICSKTKHIVPEIKQS